MPLKPATCWKDLSSPRRLPWIAGPCVIETEALCLRVAAALGRHCRRLEVPFAFQASCDKANCMIPLNEVPRLLE